MTGGPARQALTARILVDMTMIVLSWVAAYYLRFYTGLEAPLGIPPEGLYFKLVPFILAIWFIVYQASGLYRRTGSHRSAFIEALDIIQCSVLAIFVFIAFTYFYAEYRYSRITVAIFGLIHPCAVIMGRSLVRKCLRYYSRNLPARRVLIIGGGETLREALHLVKTDRSEPQAVVGVLWTGTQETRAEDEVFIKEAGYALLTIPEDWAHFLTEKDVQSVYVAVPHAMYAAMEDHLEKIADQVYDLKIVPDIRRYTRFSAGIEMVRGIPVINIHESPLLGSGGVIKRLMDICGAAVGIILLAPVMLVVAVLIPVSSRGPILYRQQRMGLDGRPFDCLKFRSMPVDSEKSTGAVWATPADNRATWLGRILRRTSIDELPQLFNVLRGDMSLVGPRPERPVFVHQFRKNVPGYMLRHKVKAGMTGWAQVNGWRGNTSIEKRIECDLFYIQNWSVWLDVKILFKTVEEVPLAGMPTSSLQGFPPQ